MNGFIPRHDKSLTIVPNWKEFVSWAEDAGYDESYFDVNDSKCLELQRKYLQEIEDEKAV